MHRPSGAPEPVTDSHGRTLAALKLSPLVAGLSAQEVEQIASHCSLYRIAPHRRVFEAGDRSKGLWVLTSGRIRLHHMMADGRQHIVGFRAPPNTLDLSSALDGRPYSASATTIDESELVLVPRSELSELGRRYPLVIRNAIDLLCLEVRQRDIATAIAALKDARGRIGCALLQLARQFGVAEGSACRIDYRLTRQDIADRAGVTVETAIRVMSDLQHRGIIRTESQVIEILDVAQIDMGAGCEDCQFECSVFAPAAGGAPGSMARG